jgi:hypothetical protein
LESCCWGAVAGELQSGRCCGRAVVGALLLRSYCWGAVPRQHLPNNSSPATAPQQ